MIYPTIIHYKEVQNDLEYTISIDYLDGSNWEVIKTFTEILSHRKKTSRKHQQLTFPIISQNGDIRDFNILEKRKYEIQKYLDYLLNSKAAYMALLDLIEFKKNSRYVSQIITEEGESSKRNSLLIPIENNSNKKSEVLINYDDDLDSKVVGDSFVEEDKLFLTQGRQPLSDDSDEEL